ncbi:MAG: redox-regulated ATPase YchF [Thermoplasmata archaeon]|nr:redox-regulated ATPase YchF [Thermoplasmata archaeon]
MEAGIVGKPNVGKSTFFSAATLAPAEIADYPFTTIEANRGVTYVRAKCPHEELGTECNPNNAPCENGTRLVPVEMLDVAGLVPDAHKGRGLGNKFLDDLRQAKALIHIVDASGGTDHEGNIVQVGSHDPLSDVRFLDTEISQWIRSILEKGWKKVVRQIQLDGLKVEKAIQERMTGLGFTDAMVLGALRRTEIGETPMNWSEDDILKLADNLRKVGKPMIVAANKCDIAPDENIKRLESLDDKIVVPTSAEAELALRRAAKSGLISYDVGDDHFEILDESKLNADQLKGLEFMDGVLKKFGSTGIQRCVEEAVFNLLDMMVVYPVEDENKWTDKDGRVLPDAYLLPRGSNAKDLAYEVHTDLGDNFIRAIDGRTKRVLGADHELKDGDIITIVARA